MKPPDRGSATSVLQVCSAPDAGAAQHVLTLSEELARRGWRVSVCCPPGWLALRCRVLGLDVHEVLMPRTPSPKDDLRAVRRIRKLVSELDIDIVHAHSAKAGAVGRLAAWMARRPCVLTPHAWSFYSAPRGLVRSVWIVIERVLSHATTTTICVSPAERDDGARARVLGRGVAVIRNGVAVLQQAPGVRTPGLVVGTAARLAQQKGVDVLVDAFAAVLRSHPGARLVIIGDGPHSAAISAQVERLGIGHAVTLTGWVEDPGEILGAFDVFVLPSRWEGLPLALLEAGALGLPSVASAVGGNTEVIVPGLNGLLVPADDPTALARAIDELLADPGRRAVMGAAARERVASEFGIGGMVDRTEDVYLRALLTPELGASW